MKTGIGRGKVYVMDDKDKAFMFTCSFGANSDYSYTGCFPKDSSIATVEQAMRAFDWSESKEGRDYWVNVNKYPSKSVKTK